MSQSRIVSVLLCLVASLWIVGCGLSDEQDTEELRTATPASSLTSTSPTSSANLTADDATSSLPPNCADFDCQELAQVFFDAQGGPAQDPYGLDANRNGKACDSLPACQSEGGGNPGAPGTPVTPPTQPPGSPACDLRGCCSQHIGITSTCSGGKVVCIDGFLSGCDCCP